MGVSTTHPILSMRILICSFDIYYVWVTCDYLSFYLVAKKLITLVSSVSFFVTLGFALESQRIFLARLA